ncbi:MAG TPA: serine/threonine-protein kinase [Kofleriaceae bacterium]|nr:serine/threonine-protein kinase [Kofleriaceae bacterium]
MTTRDPRSRVPLRPQTGPSESAREPTQSLSIEIDPADAESDSSLHPSLAVGTSDAVREDRTRVESPNGRIKTPQPKPATKPPPTPRGGEPDYALGTVLGAYKLVEMLGKGGMGFVYRAEHIKLGREVALKLLRGDYAKRRDAISRFFQEARTVNRVRHRNIVDVTDLVELDDGTTYFVMELLRGQSLGKWARTGIDLPRALAVLVQICDGLGAAHAVGVVHRDLKPDNVFVVPTSDGAELVKILDFGVAKLVNRDDEDVGYQTAAGSVIGTPAYMSPEQAGGMLVDNRSDIYSLGAIMYEMFCGQPMFRGRSFGEYVRKHLTENPMPPRQTAGGASMDPNLEALIQKCLSKDPNERFGHILELRDGLLHLLGGIETHPPAYVAMSSIRTGPPAAIATIPPLVPQPATQLALPSLPPHMLPLPPGMSTTVPTPPSITPSQSHFSQSHLTQSSVQYSHYTMQPESAHTEPGTPWWVWFVGGAIAVGLGIAGALWYANSSSEPTPTAKEPITAPIENGSAVPPQAQLVELKFDSLPSAGVYADGRSAELCKTPCNFNVDLGDGGPTDKRTFVVRTDGFKDRIVVVDFAAAQRAFSVTLDRVEATVPTVTDDTQTEEAVATTDDAQGGDDKTPTSTKKKKKKKVSKTETPDPKAQGSAQIEEKQPPPPLPDDTSLEKVEKKPEEKKPPGTIDPTDTIDPFSRKK